MQITADIGKTLKNIHGDLTLIFDVLSENVVSFTKTCFYRNRGSVTMRNYAEMFLANIDHNLA